MTKKKIADIEKWFKEYTATFYGVDEYVNTNVQLKTLHTFKVAEEMANLADDIGLSDEKANIAVITGLLHDCGRFEQLVKYKTFNDSESENHALLAIKVIERLGLIDNLPNNTQTNIKEAIKSHNAINIELAENASEDAMLFAKMIRDADKLDIFRVVKISYEQYVKDPAKANNMAMNFGQDTGKCSPEVLEDVLARNQANYLNLKTLDDRKLLQLCWVYDINFPSILQKILDRGYIEMIFNALPQTKQMEKAKEAIRKYVNEILPDYSWKI